MLVIFSYLLIGFGCLIFSARKRWTNPETDQHILFLLIVSIWPVFVVLGLAQALMNSLVWIVKKVQNA